MKMIIFILRILKKYRGQLNFFKWNLIFFTPTKDVEQINMDQTTAS
jgi:hypothetical protein